MQENSLLPMTHYRTSVYANGRISIPAPLRKAIALNEGDELVLSLKDGIIYLEPLTQVISDAQNLVAAYFTEDENLNRELEEMRLSETKLEGLKEKKSE
ncbi:transcriptional regulator, AbrB family (plasmid) [Rickettsiales bacterium Ac37b]|nr:transcriptional regulator, AbrB family [Rickettsiales bacterium Ac37b]